MTRPSASTLDPGPAPRVLFLAGDGAVVARQPPGERLARSSPEDLRRRVGQAA